MIFFIRVNYCSKKSFFALSIGLFSIIYRRNKNRDEGHSEKAEYQKVENDCLGFFFFARSPLQLNEKERRDAVRFSFSSFFSLSKRTQERERESARAVTFY